MIGVTFHAQDALGDVVYVELPRAGAVVVAGKPFGVIESTKAVSELFAPLSGTVVRANETLSTDPEIVNADPYGAGWIVQVQVTNEAEVESLMDAVRYRALLGIGAT